MLAFNPTRVLAMTYLMRGNTGRVPATRTLKHTVQRKSVLSASAGPRLLARGVSDCGRSGIRTHDLMVNSQLLYQLSYSPKVGVLSIPHTLAGYDTSFFYVVPTTDIHLATVCR